MLPISAAALAAVGLIAVGESQGFPRAPIFGLAFGLVAGGVILSILLARSALPAPDGPFGVGVTHLDLTQTSLRADGQTLDRRIAVEVWYPTGSSVDPGADRSGGADMVAHRSGSRVGGSGPIVNAAFIGGTETFPLILYIPSWSGPRLENTFLLTALASQGYVVAAIDYPDGEVLRPEVTALPTPTDLTAPMAFSSEAAYRHTLERAELRVRSQAKDALFVVAQLRSMGEKTGGTVFSGRLDPVATGIIGYSFGGAVAFQTAWLDQGVKAVVNLDGWMFGDAARSGFTTPRLYVSDDSPLPPASDIESADPGTRFSAQLNLDDDRRSRAQLAEFGGYRLQIAGTRHANFSDQPLLATFPRLAGAGPIDPVRAALIIRQFTAAFFGAQLKHQPAQLLTGGRTTFPEAKLETWPRPVPQRP
jgi:dienelactone hydrolase